MGGQGKWLPPQARRLNTCRIEPNTAHTSTTSIDSTKKGGVRINQFTPAGRPGAKRGSKKADVVQLVVDSRRKAKAIRRGR